MGVSGGGRNQLPRNGLQETAELPPVPWGCVGWGGPGVEVQEQPRNASCFSVSRAAPKLALPGLGICLSLVKLKGRACLGDGILPGQTPSISKQLCPACCTSAQDWSRAPHPLLAGQGRKRRQVGTPESVTGSHHVSEPQQAKCDAKRRRTASLRRSTAFNPPKSLQKPCGADMF